MLFESSNIESNFPEQKLSWRKKTQKWAAQCVAYGADRDIFKSSVLRRSVYHKQINYDLMNGKLHMEDLVAVVNPAQLQADYMPTSIQHFPLMNSRLDVLKGEELSRPFNFSVIVTNPNGISEIEKKKQEALVNLIQEVVASQVQSDEEFETKVQEALNDIMKNWQDENELIANQLYNHYNLANNYRLMFNGGFSDGYTVGEELYQVYIYHGEPAVRKLDPMHVRAYQMGRSSKFEDADMIVIEDWVSPANIIDLYGEYMTSKEIDYVVNYKGSKDWDNVRRTDGGENAYQERATVLDMSDESVLDSDDPFKTAQGITANDLYVPDFLTESDYPYDFDGNIKVSQVFWKSYRQVQIVHSFDPVTGEPVTSLHTEDYVPNKDMGETVKKIWIPEAWKGVKIGDDLYVNLGPCPLQYNTLDDPAKCHFGIVGSLYNFGNDKPYSLVDIMKPYNYLYDAVFDRLNRLLARNHGKLVRLDLAKVPSKWGVEQVMRMITSAGIMVENSMEEGREGAAKGKLAGAFNSASSGVVDLELGNSIQQYINTLAYIEQEMGRAVGITDQRQGQIANRETVGGVERSVLQSSHITEWWFAVHNDVVRRVIDCFIDTARACLKGTSKIFQYVTSYDLVQHIVKIDGDSFAMNSYGLVVDDGNGAQEFNKNLPMIIQAALQNQATTLSSVMQIYNANSRAEKQHIIERGEREMQERAQQAQQSQIQSQERIAELNRQTELDKMAHEKDLKDSENETKILVATIQAEAKNVIPDTTLSEGEQANLEEKKREFNETNRLARERLEFDKKNADKQNELKARQINKVKTASK